MAVGEVEINGRELRRRRIEARMDMATLATAAGIHRTRLSRLETGVAPTTTVHVLAALERALGIEDKTLLVVDRQDGAA